MSHAVAVLIVAAGRGERAGGDVPKQFRLLAGIPVIARAVDAFAGMPVIVVTAPDQNDAMLAALGNRVVTLVAGGATRQASVRAGLAAVAALGSTHVLIHDAARPLLPRRVIDALVAALDVHDGVVPVLQVSDTLARLEASDAALGRTVDRDALLRVQTPQAFRVAAIIAAHDGWNGDAATDDAQMARAAGIAVATVSGDPMLDKITHPEDFTRAQALLAGQLISRSASGYDVHCLVAGEELWLGGIRIIHTHGLSGHSDADVALHAITDALLGTLGAGDIGMHFPPSDPQWRGARSDRFLAHARDLIANAGGIVDFVDLTLICEAPKIGPHREAMRARIAEVLKMPTARVSVKATTTERLGFTGRGEGIAAQAIATVRLPEDM